MKEKFFGIKDHMMSLNHLGFRRDVIFTVLYDWLVLVTVIDYDDEAEEENRRRVTRGQAYSAQAAIDYSHALFKDGFKYMEAPRCTIKL
mgnify:CR=1 FL=1